MQSEPADAAGSAGDHDVCRPGTARARQRLGSERRAVVLLAQVGCHHMLQPAVQALRQDLGRDVVGQVPVRPADAGPDLRRIA